MISENDCMKLIMEKYPEFEKSNIWIRHCDFWKGEEAGGGLCMEVAAFGDFIVEEVLNKPNSFIDPKEIFDFLETLMVKGDEEVQTCVATCLLENLLNYVSWGDVKAESFTHLLGPESREYCKGWDEFTGVKTEGV